MFLLNEDGLLHVADYSNSPFSRPDIRILIEGALHVALCHITTCAALENLASPRQQDAHAGGACMHAGSCQVWGTSVEA